MFEKMRNMQKTGLGRKAQANILPNLRLETAPGEKKLPMDEVSFGSEVGRSAPEPVAELVSPTPAREGAWMGWAIVTFALVLRVIWLGIKPPHFDEGVNGWFVDQMTKQGYYHYDPGNYHGPFHFYVLFLMQTLFGRSVVAFRIPLVLINTATVWLLLQFDRFIPRRACLLAALAFAVSPAMLFYSRYAIHEAWFVFGMVLAFWGVTELWNSGTARGVWATAMGVTLLMLTKETFIMHLVAFGLAVATLRFLQIWMPFMPQHPPAPRQWSWATPLNALSASLFLIVFFYSGGFLDPKQDYMQRFAQAFVVWAQTGVKGNGHEKPFFYWVQLMGIYEWPAAIGLGYALRAAGNRICRLPLFQSLGLGIAAAIVLTTLGVQQALGNKGFHDFFFVTAPQISPVTYGLAILGGALAGLLYFLLTFLPPMNRLTQLLAIYGCGVLVAYSLVPYKTPWCIISIIWPFLILFGEAFDTLMDGRAWRRWLGGGLAGLILAASLAQSIWLNYFRSTDPTQRYVYVQTLDDYFKLMTPLKRLVAKDPTAWHMPAHILLSSYHPLPWALGDFTAIGYYDKTGTLPATMDAGFIVAEADRVAEVEALSRQKTGSGTRH